MSLTLDVFTTEYRGGSTGENFVDSPPSRYRSAPYLTKVILSHDGDGVHGLKLYYSWDDGKAITHGGAVVLESTSSQIIFASGEFITKIEGRSNSTWILELTFVTTTRRCGPFGVAQGESFVWSGPAPGMTFLGFSGRADTYLRGLQATFCKSLNVTHPREVRYEKLAVAGSVSNDASTNVGSTFTSHLMSPIVTLYVGQGRVEFHVHEDTLTKLPFFRAALQGQFREASKKAICMPDDDPSKITAMIEFLYTGNYTYAYDPTSVEQDEGSDAPVSNLAEGLYHLGVYVVASKYDSANLSERAVANFKSVANELDSINSLRLWQAAYAEDLQLPRSREEFIENYRREGLVSWVTGLFEENGAELEETISACPQLAIDLLRLATIGK